jgi:serine/threonine protein kinase
VKYYDCNMETTEVKENGNEKKVAYIAMEPIRGGELFDYVANSGAFNERFSRYYFKQMLTGLHYLHKNGMAHRDLKPENVMLSEKYEVKVIDFGFTCNIAGRNGSGSNSSGVGTPGYMAPEILQKRPY